MVRWDNKSKDSQDLQAMFHKGMITHDAKACQIRATNPQWIAKYDAGQFRNAFNRFKKAHMKTTLKDPPAAKGTVDCCFLLLFLISQ
jgi:hypothetical protein